MILYFGSDYFTREINLLKQLPAIFPEGLHGFLESQSSIEYFDFESQLARKEASFFN